MNDFEIFTVGFQAGLIVGIILIAIVLRLKDYLLPLLPKTEASEMKTNKKKPRKCRNCGFTYARQNLSETEYEELELNCPALWS